MLLHWDWKTRNIKIKCELTSVGCEFSALSGRWDLPPVLELADLTEPDALIGTGEWPTLSHGEAAYPVRLLK